MNTFIYVGTFRSPVPLRPASLAQNPPPNSLPFKSLLPETRQLVDEMSGAAAGEDHRKEQAERACWIRDRPA
jgi:hypothetical protein